MRALGAQGWLSMCWPKQYGGLERPMFQTLHLIARLKPEITLSQAQTSTNLLFRNILRTYVGARLGPNTLRGIDRDHPE